MHTQYFLINSTISYNWTPGPHLSYAAVRGGKGNGGVVSVCVYLQHILRSLSLLTPPKLEALT
jgi:hypothetical protein